MQSMKLWKIGKLRKIIGGACLGLVFLGQAVRADEPEATQKKPSFWSKWFGKDKNVKTVEADIQDKSKAAENDEAMVLYQQASKRAQEENEYFRRLESCDKLMEIAIQRNDLAMQRQIEELQGRIQEVYNRKTKFLSATGGSNDEVAISKSLAKSGKAPANDARARFFARDKAKEKVATADASASKKSSKEQDQ